nr:phosphocholine cytidylyltransferase family protein [Bradyrhizobium valentinum]
MSTNAPKKAVILAAGFGSRLRPLTDLRPKPLVEVNGTPILYNALRNLEAVGVKEVTIVVGYRKDDIQYACGSRFGELEIKYVESSVFDRTGSAYSLWLARDTLRSGNCFLLEGDVFFEENALRYLMVSQATDVAAVALATFRRKNRGSEGRGQPRRQREAPRGPRGDERPRLALEVDYLWSDCSSITRPMLMRLSATTPSPTQRFIPVLP